MFLPFRSASQFLVSHLRPYPRQPTFYRLLLDDRTKSKREFTGCIHISILKTVFQCVTNPNNRLLFLGSFLYALLFRADIEVDIVSLTIKRGCRDKHRKLRQCTNRRRYIFVHKHKYLKKEIIILIIKNKRNYFNLRKTFSVRLFTLSWIIVSLAR